MAIAEKEIPDRGKPAADARAQSVKPAFDVLIHSPNRLRICAALAAVAEIEFADLEAAIGITTQLMSKQLKLLSDACYVTLEKRPEKVGRPRTWAALTDAGRRAYLGHIKALREITRV